LTAPAGTTTKAVSSAHLDAAVKVAGSVEESVLTFLASESGRPARNCRPRGLMAREEDPMLGNSGRSVSSIAALAFVLMSGCGGNGSSSPGPDATPTTAPATAPLPDRPFLGWTGSDEGNRGFSFKLVRVSTAGVPTVVGGDDYLTALLYGPDGTLYGVSNHLVVVDPATGRTSHERDLTYGALSRILMMEAAFSPSGVLYVAANSGERDVFTVELATGALTPVGKLPCLARGLEFSPDGTLFAGFAELFSVSLPSLSCTSAGRLGLYVSQLSGNRAGQMWGMDIFPSTGIYTVDTGSGIAEKAVSLPITNVSSFVQESRTAAVATAAFEREARQFGIAPVQSLEELRRMEKERRLLHDLRR